MSYNCFPHQTKIWVKSLPRYIFSLPNYSITQYSDTSLKTPEDQWFHFRLFCPIHPYSAATIQAASHDETIVIQALGTLFLYTMHSNWVLALH